MKMLATGNPQLKKPVGVLKELSEDERTRLIAEAYEKARRDEASRINWARHEGREEGRREGREEGRREGREEARQEGREEARQEGREEGRKEGKREQTKIIALNLIKLNWSIDDIAEVTGLTIKEIEELN
jgi:predicted transposase YdaD